MASTTNSLSNSLTNPRDPLTALDHNNTLPTTSVRRRQPTIECSWIPWTKTPKRRKAKTNTARMKVKINIEKAAQAKRFKPTTAGPSAPHRPQPVRTVAPFPQEPDMDSASAVHPAESSPNVMPNNLVHKAMAGASEEQHHPTLIQTNDSDAIPTVHNKPHNKADETIDHDQTFVTALQDMSILEVEDMLDLSIEDPKASASDESTAKVENDLDVDHDQPIVVGEDVHEIVHVPKHLPPFFVPQPYAGAVEAHDLSVGGCGDDDDDAYEADRSAVSDVTDDAVEHDDTLQAITCDQVTEELQRDSSAAEDDEVYEELKTAELTEHQVAENILTPADTDMPAGDTDTPAGTHSDTNCDLAETPPHSLPSANADLAPLATTEAATSTSSSLDPTAAKRSARILLDALIVTTVLTALPAALVVVAVCSILLLICWLGPSYAGVLTLIELLLPLLWVGGIWGFVVVGGIVELLRDFHQLLGSFCGIARCDEDSILFSGP